jgi:hypothetical protein
MNRSSVFIIASLLSSRSCAGFATNNSNNNRLPSSTTTSLHNTPGADHDDGSGSAIQRRNALANIFRSSTVSIAAAALSALTTTVTTPQTARALDFDAFESSLITKDSAVFIPKLNDDEALCKYGAPGKAMGEACERAGVKRKLPGGVDATGKADRGDYLKCKFEFPVVNGEYVKTRVCKPSAEWEGADV